MKPFKEKTVEDLIRIRNRVSRACATGEVTQEVMDSFVNSITVLEEALNTEELHVSYTKLKTFKTCLKKYEYKYVQGLTPKERVQKVELGKYLHHLLRAKYKGLDVVAESQAYWDENTEGMFTEELDDFQEVRTTAEQLYNRYFAEYASIDATWKVIMCEESVRVPVPGTNAILQFIPDLIIEDESGTRWLVDHKITGVDFSRWEESLVLDEQANLYLWGVNQIGMNVSGVIFNLVRSKLPSVPGELKSGGLSKAKAIDTDIQTYTQAIVDRELNLADYEDILEYIKTSCKPFFGRVSTYRTPEELKVIEAELVAVTKHLQKVKAPYYRTAGQHCEWGCPYKQLCIMDIKNCDTSQYVDYMFDKRDDEPEAAA